MAWRDRAENRRKELRAEFEALAARIDGQELKFVAKAGETGKLYGSVTTNDVADQLNEALGTDIDRLAPEGVYSTPPTATRRSARRRATS